MYLFDLFSLIAMIAAMGATSLITGYISRHREGELRNDSDEDSAQRTAQPWNLHSMFWGVVIVFLFTGLSHYIIAVCGEAVLATLIGNPVTPMPPQEMALIAGWLCVDIALMAFYFFMPNRRFSPPSSLYWGVGASWGAAWLYMGLNLAKLTANQVPNALGIVLVVVELLLTAAFIIATIVWLCKVLVDLSRDNKIFFRVNEPGSLVLVRQNTSVKMAVGDTTGVPFAE